LNFAIGFDFGFGVLWVVWI